MRRALVSLACGALVLSSCSRIGFGGVPESTDEPCTGWMTYSQGAIPQSHSWKLTLHEDGTADFQAWSLQSPQDSEDGPIFEKKGLTPSKRSLVALCDAALKTDPLPEGIVGGAYSYWELAVDGSTINGEYMPPLKDNLVQSVVGEDTFSHALTAIELDHDKHGY